MKSELRCKHCGHVIGYEVTPGEDWNQPLSETRQVDVQNCTSQLVSQQMVDS